MKKEDDFKWNDAWVFTALFGYDLEYTKINLPMIIASGDMINHSIFSINDLQSGFKILQQKGLVMVKGDTIKLTSKAIEIKEKVLKMRGGLFDIVDNTLKILNSKSTRFINIEIQDISDCIFLTNSSINQAYKKNCT